MLFKRKKNKPWVAYMDGELIPIEEVPDQIFSTKMMGEGVAIIATGDVLCAPCDGEITLIAPTKHAIAIQHAQDIQVLMHIGLDSANLPEHAFEVLVEQGAQVKAGQPLIQCSSAFCASCKPLYVPMVIVENPNDISLSFSKPQSLIRGESVILTYAS